ncbi:MAG: iron ABC transporter permease [Candidatus Pristimantibacillus lignocellulolyticus]|uniref:Probable heme-iron transport system permease protein IsdF n=1 Tax=Candidatus Pristimantibacillus lignocellulolyticus TaxID=2994561 RepID=A0A9J6ZLV1_9BACL|nr:MAG: iron ABC transporter permease [Candidatus Pristimantibacillus lignocellulolyticus]
MKKIIYFVAAVVLLIAVALYSMATGSLKVGLWELIQGLIYGGNDNVDVIRDLRLPRIIVAILTGAALAVSGVLLQAVMRNPLADAGVIGISSGAGFVSVLIATLFPTLIFWMPMFSVIGGLFACFLVYLFSWRSGLQPLRLILVGVAINAMFSGLNQLFNYRGSYAVGAVNQAVSSMFSMKKWADVETLLIYVSIGLVIALLLSTWCNMLSLQDRTASNLGLRVMRARVIISFVAVLLASVATAIGGLIAFVGLLIPHIARLMVGTDHKILIPFSAISGGLLILLADTLGRTIIYSIDIPASVIMMIIGGPFLIFMLMRGDRVNGN